MTSTSRTRRSSVCSACAIERRCCSTRTRCCGASATRIACRRRRARFSSAGDVPAYVSAASIWEIAIKRASGKLRAPDDLFEQVAARGSMSLASRSSTRSSPAPCRCTTATRSTGCSIAAGAERESDACDQRRADRGHMTCRCSGEVSRVARCGAIVIRFAAQPPELASTRARRALIAWGHGHSRAQRVDPAAPGCHP